MNLEKFNYVYENVEKNKECDEAAVFTLR